MCEKPKYKVKYIPYKFLFMPNKNFGKTMEDFMNECEKLGYSFTVREAPEGVTCVGVLETPPETPAVAPSMEPDDLPENMPEDLKKLLRGLRAAGAKVGAFTIPGGPPKAVPETPATPETLRAAELINSVLRALPPNAHDSIRLMPEIVPRLCRKYTVVDCREAVKLLTETLEAHKKDSAPDHNCDLMQTYYKMIEEFEKYTVINVS